jgi:hypothetical protein
VEHQFFRVKREAQGRHDKSRSLKILVQRDGCMPASGCASPSRRLAAVTRLVALSNIGCYLSPPREEGVKIRPPAVKKPLREASSVDRGDLLGPVSILCFP